MCVLHVGDGPSGDVSVTASTKFFGKKKKTVRIKIRYLALKNSLFLVSKRNDNIFRGCAQKMEFPEGGWGPFCEADFGKSRGEGGHRENPFRGGGVWIFSGTTHFGYL